MVKDAHGVAPILIYIGSTVDPVHILVPAAEAEVAAWDYFRSKVPTRSCGKFWVKNEVIIRTLLVKNNASQILPVFM